MTMCYSNRQPSVVAVVIVAACMLTEHPGIVSQGRPLSFYGRHQCKAEESLLHPDDSLAAHEDLATMAMLSTQPSTPCNITRLLLPSESTTQLNPSVLPQVASDNHNTIYHVTTAARDSQVTPHCLVIDSVPSLGVYYFLSLTLYVCHAAPSNQFFFCFSMESRHFLAVSSPCGPVQNFFLQFLI